MPPPFPPKARQRLGLFQHAVRITQQSIRQVDVWLAKNIGGMSSSESDMNMEIQPRYVDLWRYTFFDHIKIFSIAYKEYKESFKTIDDSSVHLKDVKEDFKAAFKGVQKQADTNIKYLKSQVDASNLSKNLSEIKSTATLNRDYIKEGVEKLDLQSKIDSTTATVMELQSDKSLPQTLQKNVETIQDIVQEGKKAALNMSKDDVKSLKESFQTWLADKLLVAHAVVMAFIEGYREGKKLELEREDAILVTFVKETAKEHATVLKSHLESFVDKEKQKQDPKAPSK